ncbi:hypothetical protein [Microbacterium sp.]|uniref:hypothetical protein n=1 Tax=Microbacterium sp. TaxID=51671 RepID=UPI0037351A36
MSDLTIPEGGVLLHIGPYKTGSTAIQSAMFAAKEQMHAHGVAYPGRWRRAMRPGWAVLNYTPRGREPVAIELWEEFAREVRERTEPRACVSTEDFGSAGPKYALRIAEDLGGEAVHVVAVARRLDRLLPSQWQERVKSHDTYTYEQWLEMVLADRSSEGGEPPNREWRRFWASHDVTRMFERWEPAVGRDRFHLIVTDDSDRTLIPRSFESLLGLPEGLLELPPSANASLTWNATELLRRLNEVFAEEEWPDRVYHRLIQRGAILRMTESPRSAYERPIPKLPVWAAERAAEISARRVAEIRERGIHVIGDLDALSMSREVVVAGSSDELAPTTVAIPTMVAAMVGIVEESVLQTADIGTKKGRRKRRRQRRLSETGPSFRVGDPRRVPISQAPTRDLLAVALRRGAGRVRALGTRSR